MEIATTGNIILEQSLPLLLWVKCQGDQVGLYVQAFSFSFFSKNVWCWYFEVERKQKSTWTPLGKHTYTHTSKKTKLFLRWVNGHCREGSRVPGHLDQGLSILFCCRILIAWLSVGIFNPISLSCWMDQMSYCICKYSIHGKTKQKLFIFIVLTQVLVFFLK